MRCIKCGEPIAEVPERRGYRCAACRSVFLDAGLLKGGGAALDLAGHPSEAARYSCPTDRTPLRHYRLRGVEFEHCPACRHIWLDDGEMQLLADRAGRPDTDGNGTRIRSNFDFAGIDIPADAFELIAELVKNLDFDIGL